MFEPALGFQKMSGQRFQSLKGAEILAVEVRGHHLVSRRVPEENAHLRVHEDHVQNQLAVLVVVVEVPGDAQGVGAEAGTSAAT
jgi:hypothetical protein